MRPVSTGGPGGMAAVMASMAGSTASRTSRLVTSASLGSDSSSAAEAQRTGTGAHGQGSALTSPGKELGAARSVGSPCGDSRPRTAHRGRGCNAGARSLGSGATTPRRHLPDGTAAQPSPPRARLVAAPQSASWRIPAPGPRASREGKRGPLERQSAGPAGLQEASPACFARSLTIVDALALATGRHPATRRVVSRASARPPRRGAPGRAAELLAALGGRRCSASALPQAPANRGRPGPCTARSQRWTETSTPRWWRGSCA